MSSVTLMLPLDADNEWCAHPDFAEVTISSAELSRWQAIAQTVKSFDGTELHIPDKRCAFFNTVDYDEPSGTAPTAFVSAGEVLVISPAGVCWRGHQLGGSKAYSWHTRLVPFAEVLALANEADAQDTPFQAAASQ